MNHTNYELSKKLKEFLGKDAPEPNGGEWYIKNQPCPNTKKHWSLSHDDVVVYGKLGTICYPAYTLEDILSKPFCEAFTDSKVAHRPCNPVYHQDYLAELLALKYYIGGFPAVEKELERLMEGK